MKAPAVVVLMGLVGLIVSAGAGPAGADVVEGTKQFLHDCTLHMEAEDGEDDPRDFVQTNMMVWDSGSECLDYFITGLSMTTESGYHLARGISSFGDYEDEADLERIDVRGDYVPFLYGDVNVYIPSKSRCDRYRLDDAGRVRLIGSEPCRKSAFPAGVKKFLKDCALLLDWEVNRSAEAQFFAKDVGSECGEYVLRGASVVDGTGLKVTVGLSDGDGNPDPDLEELVVGVHPPQTYGSFAFGTVNVYVPYRNRCDQYRLYPDRHVSHVGSYPCTEAG